LFLDAELDFSRLSPDPFASSTLSTWCHVPQG
jgi:hypothetical protein